MICYKKNEKNPQISCPFSELPMFKPKLLFQFQCLRLKAKVARKAFDVSFPVVLFTTLVNIEKKLRKTTFCKSLCLPSKVQNFFFLRIFVFFGQKSACTMFLTRPKTFGGSIRTFSCMGCIVLDTLYCSLWSLNQWIVLKKMRCWKK